MADQIGDAPQVVDPAPEPVDATSIRYQIQAKTLAGDLYTVYVLDAEYVGDSTILQADDTLIRFEKGEEDGTYESGVIPTTADLYIRDKEPLSVLFGGDDKRFRAVVYKGERLFMTGWLLPDFYERDPYSSVPATKLSIADGLHLLKDRSMQDVLQEAVSVGDRGTGTDFVVFEDGDDVIEAQDDWYRVRDILWALLPKGRAVEGELQYQVTVDAGDEVTTQLVGPASPTTSYKSGDGQEATGPNATFTYDTAGTYTIALGPASIAATLPLDIAMQWWAADTVQGNSATSDTEPLGRFAMSAAHFQDDEGAFFSAFDGLQEICDLFGADFQQVPRPDQGASWLFRQRSVFSGVESPVVELEFQGVAEQDPTNVEIQVVDQSGRPTTFSATERDDVVGSEATFSYPFGFDYRITLAQQLDLDAQVWRYEDNVLTDDSPFTRVFGLDTNAWAFDFEHTEQYERRLSSVVAIYNHEQVDTLITNGGFEQPLGDEWEILPGADSFEREEHSSLTKQPTVEDQFFLDIKVVDVGGDFVMTELVRQSFQWQAFERTAAELSLERRWFAFFRTTTPQRPTPPGISLKIGSAYLHQIARRVTSGSLAGEAVQIDLESPVNHPIPEGARLPIVEDTATVFNPLYTTAEISEPAEAGDTVLTVRLNDEVDSEEADYVLYYLGFVDGVPPEYVHAVSFVEMESTYWNPYTWTETADYQQEAWTFSLIDDTGQRVSGAGTLTLSGVEDPDTEAVGLKWLVDNIKLSAVQAPDKTVSVAATDLEGESLDISVSSGSGPLRDSPRRLLWMRDESVGQNALRVDRILIGTAFGDDGPLLSEVQALEKLKQYNEHTRTLSLTTRRRLGERLIGGDEIISYDGRLWTVQRVVTQGRSQQLTLVAIQEDTLLTTTITRLTDDVDAVRIDEEITYASRR